MSKGVFTPSLLRLPFVTVLLLQSLLLPSNGSSLELLLAPAVGARRFRAALAGLRGVEGQLSTDSGATSRAPGPAERLRGEGGEGLLMSSLSKERPRFGFESGRVFRAHGYMVS